MSKFSEVSAEPNRFSRARKNETDQTIVFYDGVCGVCNRFVVFLLNHKPPADLRFASLQGRRYAELKSCYPALAGEDTLVIYRREDNVETIRLRSEGVLWLLPQLEGWPRLTLPLNLIPLFVLNLGYRCVARFRHRLSKSLGCPVFPEKFRGYFLDEP